MQDTQTQNSLPNIQSTTFSTLKAIRKMIVMVRDANRKLFILGVWIIGRNQSIPAKAAKLGVETDFAIAARAFFHLNIGRTGHRLHTQAKRLCLFHNRRFLCSGE
jgi:hypothetical protein